MAIEHFSNIHVRDDNVAASLNSPETVISWMDGLIEEWRARDTKVYSMAVIGECRLRPDEGDSPDPFAADLFAVIEDQMEGTFHYNEMKAGFERLAELLKARVTT